MPAKPRILVVEDEPLIAEDIADLCTLNGYDVCGTAYTASQALTMIAGSRPSLVLLDINLGGSIDGLDIAAHLKENYSIPFIFLTSYADSDTLARARDTSPLGYIVKPFNKEQLFSTIEIAWAQVHQHNLPGIDLEELNAWLPEPLRPREVEVLACLFKGMDNKAIAKALFISANTVKFHLKNLYARFDVRNRVELLLRIQELADKRG